MGYVTDYIYEEFLIDIIFTVQNFYFMIYRTLLKIKIVDKKMCMGHWNMRSQFI